VAGELQHRWCSSSTSSERRAPRHCSVSVPMKRPRTRFPAARRRRAGLPGSQAICWLPERPRSIEVPGRVSMSSRTRSRGLSSVDRRARRKNVVPHPVPSYLQFHKYLSRFLADSEALSFMRPWSTCICVGGPAVTSSEVHVSGSLSSTLKWRDACASDGRARGVITTPQTSRSTIWSESCRRIWGGTEARRDHV
jgi:hypothetical protein